MLCINWSGLGKLFAWTAATARTGSALVQERAQPEIVITYRPLATTYDFLPWVGLQQELLPQCLSSGRLRCQSQIFSVVGQEWVGLPQGVGGGTRPGILPWLRQQPCLYGVALDVAAATQQILPALNGRALEPSRNVTKVPTITYESILSRSGLRPG